MEVVEGRKLSPVARNMNTLYTSPPTALVPYLYHDDSKTRSTRSKDLAITQRTSLLVAAGAAMIPITGKAYME